MPAKPNKTCRIRVKTLDGKTRTKTDLNKLKSNTIQMSHLDIEPTNLPCEFIVCSSEEKHIEQAITRLKAAGLEKIEGDTTVTEQNDQTLSRNARGKRPYEHYRSSNNESYRTKDRRRVNHNHNQRTSPADQSKLKKKPYNFVCLPQTFKTSAPIWHDGAKSKDRLSGEIRFELEPLTPLLVGWERGQIGNNENDWPVTATLSETPLKSILCPLRAPWGKKPVIIPGDSLKGLLRHELGALLGAPIERVAERSYSYRPNQKFLYDKHNPLGSARLEPRLARVRTSMPADINGKTFPVPEQVDVLSMAMRDQQVYFPRSESRGRDTITIHPPHKAEPYKGGLGGGQALPSQILEENVRHKIIHTHIDVSQLHVEQKSISISKQTTCQYTKTLIHLLNINEGHFSSRHPRTGTDQQKQCIGKKAIESGAARAFQPGDLIWVEWDTEKKEIVSFGWHYYYRWAYTDSVRKTGGKLERHGLFPLDKEREKDSEGAPTELSAVRRLLGYTGDNDGSEGIGKGDYTQLMGRIFVNSGLEVVSANENDNDRFLNPTFLKELGMPRPSAVEHYLKQPDHPKPKGRTDKAELLTYGDAAGYDTSGELAGRKFYLDRKDVYGTNGKGLVPGPAANDSPENRQNERSTLALEASKPGRKFRFTLRFHDLDAAELASILVALCPEQFKTLLNGTHVDGYCSKLGYARPLGWGSVCIKTQALLMLDELANHPTLKPEADLSSWVENNYQRTETQKEWLAIHRRNHPDAADYPTAADRDGNNNIYSYHTKLRADHSRNRRYKKA